jgi:hypothetical protein
MAVLGPPAGSADAAPAWSVSSADIAYLSYGEPDRPLLSISCGHPEGEAGKDASRVEVEVEKGTKPGTKKVILVVEHKGGKAELPLKAMICGGETPCPNQPDGEIDRYEMSMGGRQLALDIAEKGQKLSIDAPGAKLSVPADEESFKRFAGFCRNW